MPCTRHIIVCEGESEWAYLQRLQSFLDQQELAEGEFEPALRFICPERVIVKGGTFGKLQDRYKQTYEDNPTSSIQIWADFDLYHRNYKSCADNYKEKTEGIPDFQFSFHNFEDFFALHSEGEPFQQWLRFGRSGHFDNPRHARDYLPKIKEIFPDYGKGALAPEFITWESLKNLKRNKRQQPSSSNPHNLPGIPSFADFLIAEIERAYPGSLA
jgi:hypothetical protein